jgi:hypothetical protein
MGVQRLSQLVRLAMGLPAYLRPSLGPEAARRQIAERMAQRTGRFVDVMTRLVFDRSESPYFRLMARAGVTAEDLARSARARGIEQTLADLRDRGVYLTLNEVRAREPIRRDGLVIEPREDALVNPLLAGGLPGRSSGTRSAGTAVAYTWPFLEEEAAAECLLYEQHGLGNAALAMWLPGPPGIAAVHNLLLHLRTGRPPARWFSHTPLPPWTRSPINRAALGFLLGASRACGVSTPRMEHLPMEHAAEAARWLAPGGARDAPPRRMLKTYTSSAVRVAAAAREHGLDVSGQVVFTGGEPLTAERRSFIESVGLEVHPRYVTTESGLVGAACGARGNGAPDRMHVYEDRLTIIPGLRAVAMHGRELSSLQFTSLSLHTPRVLLNAELGDFGVLERSSCGCLFGALGMELHVSHVTSPEKLTGEGMNLVVSELQQIVGRLVMQRGGSPDDCQLRSEHDGAGLARLAIVVHPSVQGIDEEMFFQQLWREMEHAGAGADLAARLWREAGAVRIVRELPRPTSGHKMLPLDPVP